MQPPKDCRKALSSLFTSRIVTFPMLKTDTTMQRKKCNTASRSRELIDKVPMFDEDIQSSPSRSGSVVSRCQEVSKRCWKCCYSSPRSKNTKRHLCSSHSLKKFDSRTKTELKDDDQLVQNRHIHHSGAWHCRALSYWTYRLADGSSHYHNQVTGNVSKWAERVQIQIRSRTFNSFNLF